LTSALLRARERKTERQTDRARASVRIDECIPRDKRPRADKAYPVFDVGTNGRAHKLGGEHRSDDVVVVYMAPAMVEAHEPRPQRHHHGARKLHAAHHNRCVCLVL